MNYGDHMRQDKDGKQVRARGWMPLYKLERPAKPSSHVLYFQRDPCGSLLSDALLHPTHGFHQGQQQSANLIHCDNSNTQSSLKQEPRDDSATKIFWVTTGLPWNRILSLCPWFALGATILFYWRIKAGIFFLMVSGLGIYLSGKAVKPGEQWLKANDLSISLACDVSGACGGSQSQKMRCKGPSPGTRSWYIMEQIIFGWYK